MTWTRFSARTTRVIIMLYVRALARRPRSRHLGPLLAPDTLAGFTPSAGTAFGGRYLMYAR
jgi:hypothetical protein